MNTEALAMVFEKVKEPFLAEQIQLPALEEGEVLAQTTYATICSSDLHTYYGRRGGHSHSILGHEIIGKIVAIGGESVSDFYGKPLKVGDSITWSVYVHDPNCEMTRRGIPQKSKNLYKYGHERSDGNHKLNGGFATHCHLKKGSTIFRIPETLSPQEAAPINCTHATIAGAIRLAGDLHGKNVLISGVGMLGLSACAMAKENGAKNVWATDIETEKINQALQFGANHTFNANLSLNDIRNTMEASDDMDVVIETSGVPSAIEKTLELLGIGGTMVLVGSVYSQRNISINAEHILRYLLTIKGLHNYIPEDLAFAIAFMEKAKDKYPFHALVGREFPLAQLDAAFDSGNTGNYYRIGIKSS